MTNSWVPPCLADQGQTEPEPGEPDGIRARDDSGDQPTHHGFKHQIDGQANPQQDQHAGGDHQATEVNSICSLSISRKRSRWYVVGETSRARAPLVVNNDAR